MSRLPVFRFRRRLPIRHAALVACMCTLPAAFPAPDGGADVVVVREAPLDSVELPSMTKVALFGGRKPAFLREMSEVPPGTAYVLRLYGGRSEIQTKTAKGRSILEKGEKTYEYKVVDGTVRWQFLEKTGPTEAKTLRRGTLQGSSSQYHVESVSVPPPQLGGNVVTEFRIGDESTEQLAREAWESALSSMDDLLLRELGSLVIRDRAAPSPGRRDPPVLGTAAGDVRDGYLMDCIATRDGRAYALVRVRNPFSVPIGGQVKCHFNGLVDRETTVGSSSTGRGVLRGRRKVLPHLVKSEGSREFSIRPGKLLTIAIRYEPDPAESIPDVPPRPHRESLEELSRIELISLRFE